jgi:hypothetical protein
MFKSNMDYKFLDKNDGNFDGVTFSHFNNVNNSSNNIVNINNKRKDPNGNVFIVTA